MKKVKLGEVCEIRIGKTPNRSQTLYWGGDYPWLSISDMKGKILCTTKEKITQEAVQKEKMQIVSKGTVVMSFKLSIGKVGILAENMYTNEAIANFVVKNNKMLFNEYLYYALQGMNFDSLTDRAVMGKTLNKAKLNNLSIVYNEPFMQQQIVLRLDGVNKLIESRKQQLSELSKLVKSLLALFITAKQVEGCSAKTIRYYQRTIENLFTSIKQSVTQLTTDDLRSYLAQYQSEKDCSKANLDNIRRILSSFFAWLEQEEYIIKNPIRRIKKIKTEQTVKETYTDEHLEIMRDNCENLRDLAMIDLLASTGMRVGELVQLNRSDIDFENRECVVFGKGKKERPVYFDARTKIHLKNYIKSREDNHPALFVSLLGKAQRLGIAGVEIRLRKLGQKLGIQKVHPHKFRRTLATKAIDKGMPIEQVQKLLGHSKIDTTLAYAMVNQSNVKHSHQKFIS